MLKKAHVYLGTRQYKALKSISEKTGITITELVKRAVSMYIEKRRITDSYIAKPRTEKVD
ncbi:MAG: hypothetical protein DRZ76_01785 [Candidatus Nealsonbacteria bacterium]|nr:MAG: hypothetical protein DRZ76_01785 [Candidatus Nealsonbacteria bacterium]